MIYTAMPEAQKKMPAAVSWGVKLGPWWLWIGGISLVFIALTTLAPYMPDSIRYSGLHHFDLGREKNLATWWSTLTLLIPAILACQIAQNQPKHARTGWLLLSLSLIVLSIDEIGSVHERYAWFASPLPYYTAIAMLMLGSLVFLWIKKETRKVSYWVALAFMLMFSVAMQEKIEHSLFFPEWFKGIRVGIEEGTELMGQFLILGALTPWLRKKEGENSLSLVTPNPLLIQGLQLFLIAGLVFHAAISYRVAIGYEVNNLGNPAMWYPLAVFFLLFCLAVWKFWVYNPEKRVIWAALAALFLLNSIAMVYMISPRPGSSHVYSLGVFSSFYFFTLIQVLLFFFLSSKLARVTKPTLVGLALLVVLLVIGYFVQLFFIQFLLGGVSAIVIFNWFLSSRGQYEKAFVRTLSSSNP